jgi:hypothetical protein
MLEKLNQLKRQNPMMLIVQLNLLASPEKEKYFLFIYEVITWEKRKKALLFSSYKAPCFCFRNFSARQVICTRL